MEGIKEKIQQAAEQSMQEGDLADCFILDISIKEKRVEVYADTDEGIKFWQCQKMSRAIESYLDESLILGEAYTLEVSSPGVDKPLQLYRQYPRNVGRQLKVSLIDDKEVEGKLEEINEQEMTLKVAGAKKGMFKTRVIPFEEVKSSLVMVSFKKKKKK